MNDGPREHVPLARHSQYDSFVRVTGRPPEWKTGKMDGGWRNPAGEEENEEEESRQKRNKLFRRE